MVTWVPCPPALQYDNLSVTTLRSSHLVAYVPNVIHSFKITTHDSQRDLRKANRQARRFHNDQIFPGLHCVRHLFWSCRTPGSVLPNVNIEAGVEAGEGGVMDLLPSF